MNWILFALVSPILLTLVNHLDKYLIEKYFNDGGVGALMIFSSLAGILVLPLAFVFSSENIFGITLNFTIILIIIGILSALAVFAYLFALKDEEATVVVPFYQTIPIFSGILGYFFLGEIITLPQIVGMLIILSGSVILSLEFDDENNFKFKTKTVVLMLISSFIFAVNAVIFKKIALESSFWTSIFWENMGLVITGLFIFVFFRNHRKQFLWVFKKNKGKIMTFNIINEVLVLTGNISLQYALILAPVALVLLVDSYQPIFVLIWTIVFYFLFPKIFREKVEKKHIVKNATSILIICLGTTILYIF